MWHTTEDNLSLESVRNEMTSEAVTEMIFNSLKGKKYFEVVCLSEPTTSQQKKALTRTGIYNPIRIRPLDIHGFILPNPCSTDIPLDQVPNLVDSHPLAFALRPLGTENRPPVFGDVLRCFFTVDGPNNGGRLRGIRYDYPLKNHKFNFECAQRLIKSKKNVEEGYVLLGSVQPQVVTQPNIVWRELNQATLAMQSLDNPEDEDEDLIPETAFEFDERIYHNPTPLFTDWLKWNIFCGNIPTYMKSPALSENPGKLIAKFPRTRRTYFCDELKIPDGIRFYNNDYILVPSRDTPAFTEIPVFNQKSISIEYQRTMVLRALPFTKGYRYPFNRSEFSKHLETYPELAAHWTIHNDHQCPECVEFAKDFWGNIPAGEKSALFQKAQDPHRGGVPKDYESYMYDKNHEIPEVRKYKAIAGDSVWRISTNKNITPEEFRKWNGLPNNTIHPNREYAIEDPNGERFQAPGNPVALIYKSGYDMNHKKCTD